MFAQGSPALWVHKRNLKGKINCWILHLFPPPPTLKQEGEEEGSLCLPVLLCSLAATEAGCRFPLAGRKHKGSVNL